MDVMAVEDVGAGPSIGSLQLSLIAFFLTCGGPFGVEPAIQTGGPLLTLLALLLIPFLWSFPQALMTAELATMMPENGGSVLWVQRAFGPFAGWVNSWCGMLSFVFDLPVYPVMAVEYIWQYVLAAELTELGEDDPGMWWAAFGLKVVIVLIVVALNLYGLELVGNVSIAMSVVILLPFLFEIYYLVTYSDAPLDFGVWLNVAQPIMWGPFLGVLLWNSTGWDALGAQAGEIKDAQKTLPRGILGAVVLIFANYFIPVFLGVLRFSDTTQWDDGYLGYIAQSLAPWLGVWVMVAAVVSSVGQFNAQMAAASRLLWAMAGGAGDRPSVWTGFSIEWARRKTPAVAIVSLGVLAIALSVFDFSFLVQVNVFLNNVTLLLEFAAFLYYRISAQWADKPRPYKVGCGWAGVAIITVPKVLFVTVSMILADWIVIAIGLGFVGALSAIYVVINHVLPAINPGIRSYLDSVAANVATKAQFQKQGLDGGGNGRKGVVDRVALLDEEEEEGVGVEEEGEEGDLEMEVVDLGA